MARNTQFLVRECNNHYCCYNLTSASIPNSLTSIGVLAFNDCSGLTSVYSYIEEPTGISYDTFSDYTKPTLYVPKGTKDMMA